MKRLTALTLALIMALTLAACGDNSPAPSGDSTPTPPQTQSPSAPNGGETPDSAPDSTPDPTPSGYGTIPMPDGFPENPGDAEYFNPATGDYMMRRINHSGDDTGFYYLVSYDAEGNAVQFAAKRVYRSADDVIIEGFPDEAYGDILPGQGVTVGNVTYIDYLTVDDGLLETRFPFYGMFQRKSDILIGEGFGFSVLPREIDEGRVFISMP